MFKIITSRIDADSQVFDFGADIGRMCRRLRVWFFARKARPAAYMRIFDCEVTPVIFYRTKIERLQMDFVSRSPFPDLKAVYPKRISEQRPESIVFPPIYGFHCGGRLQNAIPSYWYGCALYLECSA